jgi:ATP-dependent RNA helicase RhlE
MSFTHFGLSEPVMRGVEDSGYQVPTEIQQKAIPLVLQGRDIIGCAPTGTGKTAAFVLPMLDRLQHQPDAKVRRFPRALILTPTRELCLQIEEAIFTYGKYVNFRPLALFGGVKISNQLNGLRQGVDAVVATPGRLQDHMDRRTVDLSRVEILVLDEADRMFDMGFIRDVRRIIAQVPRQRQTLLFSATISREVRSLVADIQHDPQLIEIGRPFTPVETVTQHFYSVLPHSKLELLVHILDQENIGSMLVFSRTKHGADRIHTKLLSHGIRTAAIHSNRSQSQRQRALDGFKKGEYQVLVATDLASRGIDVDGISHVVNYDTPVFPEDYIHRIGRTGRAEATGIALTFVTAEEQMNLRKIESATGRRFELQGYPGFHGTDDFMVKTRAALAPIRPAQPFGRGKRPSTR